MRGKKFLLAFLLLILNTALLYAQPSEPCAGTDPDATCPLDSWVIILAVVALVLATIRLYKKYSDQTTKFS